MDAGRNESPPVKSPTTVERRSDRELVVTRAFKAPARIVYEAWTKAELFRRWWVPESFGLNLLSCEMDVRVGGRYCLTFRHGDTTMEFFGTYVEVVPNSRLVWTNEEAGGQTITTVTFEENGGQTLVVVRDLYPPKEALDAAIASGSTGGLPDQFEQLEKLLATLHHQIST
jgi:uncharacterized protein YndB with AHSA1/START domain